MRRRKDRAKKKITTSIFLDLRGTSAYWDFVKKAIGKKETNDAISPCVFADYYEKLLQGFLYPNLPIS